MAVGDLLQDAGEEVVYTRIDDVYDSPFQKAQMANAADADWFISFHRNSSENPNQYEGVETLVFDKSGEKAVLAEKINQNLSELGFRNIGVKERPNLAVLRRTKGVETLVFDKSGEKAVLAEKINQNLSELGFRNIGVKERPNLAVLRRTKMPAILIEAGFINSDRDNERFDSQFDEIAKKIADAILETVGQQGGRYHVQVGAYHNKKYAEAMAQRLMEDGFPAAIISEGGYQKVISGSFENLNNAVRMEQRLRKAGYPTFIIKKL